MFNKIKTPHGNASNHLRNMYAYFLFAALLVLSCDFGLTADAASIWVVLVGSVVASAIALCGGIFVTMVCRSSCNLIQVGRVLQYFGFWVACLGGLKAISQLFSGISLTHPLTASLLFFGVAFGAATAFGEVPLRGRTWWPVKAKAKK